MTDEDGSESPPVHDHVPAEEHPLHEADAGVWSDDHPPVDDFADHGSANEEVATASQEVAAEGDETSSSSVPAQSRSMLPLFAGIGGVLLVGAVIYWQFGHSSPPPVMSPAQISAPKSASSVSSASVQSNPKAPSNQDTDIAALYKSAPESAPTTAPTTPTTSMAPPLDMQPSAPSVLPPANATAPSTPPGMLPSAPATAADTHIDTINARIDNLQKSINDATRQLNQLSNMVAANQAMPPVPSQTNPALEDRLNKIEQNLMQIEHNEAKAPPVLVPAETTGTSETAVTKTVTHRAKAPAKHKFAHKKTKAHRSSSIASANPRAGRAESATTLWILRAATPNEAWVATDARTTELRHVQVGDTLAGIGEIRAIRQSASGWEIEGSTGSIR